MNEETAILFENYLSNSLSNEEKILFEEQLQKDTEYRYQFDAYQETSDYLKHKFSKETEDFKTTLNKVSEANASSNKSKVISMPTKWLAIAATLVLFVCVWFATQNTLPVYSDYNNHELAHFVERGESNAVINEIEASFNSKDYEKVVALFENINVSENNEFQLYYAISLIEINSFEKAETNLNQLINGKSVYKEKAIWYLGLAQLKQEKYNLCKQTLMQLTENADDYQKAQVIIKNID